MAECTVQLPFQPAPKHLPLAPTQAEAAAKAAKEMADLGIAEKPVKKQPAPGAAGGSDGAAGGDAGKKGAAGGK